MKPVPIKILLIFLIVAGFVVTCILLDTLGKLSRRGNIPPFQQNSTLYLAHSTFDLYEFWKKMGVKGAVMVHAGRYLHYETPDPPFDYLVTGQYPLVVIPQRNKHEKEISYRNFLWNALHSQMARKLYYQLTPEAFKERFPDGATEKEKTADGGIWTHDLGKQRIIGTFFPHTMEPLVLNVDASFLASSSGTTFLEELAGFTAPSRLITICLAEDNPDVTFNERARAMELLNSGRLVAAGIKIVEISSARKRDR